MAQKHQYGKNRVYKRIEVIGISTDSFEDAVGNAVKKAAETVSGLSWFEVKDLRGALRDGSIVEYQVTAVLNFEVK
jgi:flavin-binding protein dodecin